MLTMEGKAGIRYAVLVAGKSQRQVAKETGRSRNTIRRMLEESDVPRYQQRQERKRPVLGPFKALLERWVEEDAQKAKKRRRTARRMYQLLKEEHGYQGAEPTVRVYVGKLRRKAKKKLYVPLAYEPGETGQIDFGEAEVKIGGKEVTVHLFLVWLGYSGATFVQAYPAETQEVFFAGHVAAFDFFGAVPQEIWYDNLTIAVQKILKGSGREEQDRFISFRTHYLFQAEFCNPASGWEKGGVEGRVGYVRRNWLIGAGEFENWEALNRYLDDRCRQYQSRQLPGRTQSIGEGLRAEQAAMRSLPARPYLCCKTIPVQANSYSLVTFATNRYSVPVEKAHEALTLRAFVDRIEISCGAEVVAVHDRCWEREQDLLIPHHYLPLLAQKPRAFAHARAIRAWQQVWPPIFDTYFGLLKARYARSEATRYFVEVLKLSEHYSEAQLARALEEAVGRHCLHVADVRELLRRLSEEGAPLPAPLTEHPQFADIQVKPPDLNRFNQLLSWMGDEPS